MLLAATAAIALGRKVADDQRKKKEAKQGLMRVGHSDVAKQAFANQTTKTLQDGRAGVQRSPTDIKYEDPDSLDMARSVVDSSGEATAPLEGPDKSASPSPSTDLATQVHSEGALVISTANTSKDEPHNVRSRPASALSSGPPPYSPRRDVLTETSSSVYSQDSDRVTFATSTSSSSTSNDGNALRIRTKGPDLKSGFSYHPALFDLEVRPELWDRFTHQVVETTKFSAGDHAKIWAAATATACTGAIITSTLVGRSMNRSLQEQKVKEGLLNTSAGGLGDTLQQWNDSYFRERGIHVHLELSDSARKKEDGRGGGGTFRKPASLYSSREERDKKREDRKFVIVVTKLEQESQPTSTLEQISEMAAEGPGAMSELPVTEDAKFNVVELPGDTTMMPVELPAMKYYLPGAYSLGYGSEKLEPPVGFAELDSDPTHLLEKTRLADEKGEWKDEELSGREPLMVTASTYEALNKETT
ncbi:hypothetical protein LTR91_011704 [Friedmanniomyces endolithicus]|uniref:Uncharacterized protein n=1 Tax=Friedmanniomyces endolithicus TaxID=329885 RepID=A0AAN6QRI5_9PEZI|nr:hypothetical protein LTR57_003314 [Friedmanniomyces endolithicus]KAK0982120.1 hypothetical protein LTR91_011704 [Friedmanniomyces endolithicus]KAK1051627.1 hypothetical protein LTS16_002499 [Friedmanniomyces endolithicus]